MKLIPLSNGLHAQVDDKHYDFLIQFNWFPKKHKKDNTTYAIANGVENGRRVSILMHRLILGLKRGDGKKVDHEDHNGLNNQEYNMRICTQAQNNLNKKSHKDSGSKYKGVSWVKKQKKWKSEIQYMGKIIYLGSYSNEEDAARAYNTGSLKYHKEFGSLNII